ncbi:hypothetical protein M0R72_19870 [Candidatus Pacearchaeota archaeon]|jgi:hypothetical protein|nr:hypothetical protein [Candidatus Pacearchaeota archaeon]
MANVSGVRFVMSSFGRGCNGGSLLSYGAVVSVENPYGDAEKYFLVIDQMTHEKSGKYENIPLKEYEALCDLPRVRPKQICTTHDGGPDWPDCYAGHFAWILVLPDGRCIGMLNADMDGRGETMYLKGHGVA